MQLYHGSSVVVEQPKMFDKYRPMDFGAGFYTTLDKEQAQRFARSVYKRDLLKGKLDIGKFVNIYKFDYDTFLTKFNVLVFETAGEEWLDLVSDYRKETYNGTEYDAIVGPVANDTVYSVLDIYWAGGYTKQETIDKLLTHKLANQMTFKTAETLEWLEFISVEEVSS